MTRTRLYPAAGVLLVALSSGGSANAAPPPARGLELGARVAWNLNDQGTFALVGLRLGGRVVPHFGLGAYADAAPLFSPITPKCGGCEPAPERPLRLGVYGDLHLLPSRVVDPWFRLAFGFLRTARSSPDVELGFGLDFRHRRFAGGPFVMWVAPLDEQQPKRWLGAGGQVSVSFF